MTTGLRYSETDLTPRLGVVMSDVFPGLGSMVLSVLRKHNDEHVKTLMVGFYLNLFSV